MPLAYAHVNSDGTLGAATPNVSCVWDQLNTRYIITITGEIYSVGTHITVVTPRTVTGAPVIATVNSGSGQLFVRDRGGCLHGLGRCVPHRADVRAPHPQIRAHRR